MTGLAETPGFALPDVPLLSRATVDRSEWLRTDTARQARLWPGSWVLPVAPGGRAPVRADARGGARLALRPAPDVAGAPVPGGVLLGTTRTEPAGEYTAYWAVPVPDPDSSRVPGEHWRDLRGCGAELDDTDAGLLTAAVALLGWHARAGFCAICGSRTAFHAAGWVARCVANEHEEYPRTDPAVICLVRDQDDRHVLLARQSVWPAGRYSVLAGFVEVGESLEACVVREIGEEVGVAVRDVRYLGSQPWPFPRSLMIGFSAVADIDAPLVPADGEIADARWVSRAELLEAFDRGAWSERVGPVRDGPVRDRQRQGSAPLVLPGPVSIARRMLEGWAAAAPGETG